MSNYLRVSVVTQQTWMIRLSSHLEHRVPRAAANPWSTTHRRGRRGRRGRRRPPHAGATRWKRSELEIGL